MASRHPMPNVYARPAKEKKEASSPSVSNAVKSFFTMPQSYPIVSSSSSRYPLPTVYATQSKTTTKSTPQAQQQRGSQAQMPAAPRSSAESWDTVDQLKEDQLRS